MKMTREIPHMKPAFEFKPQTSSLAGEPINSELKAHAIAIGAGWKHHEAIAMFHEWAERFNREFRLALEVPAIAIGHMSARLYGTYCADRNPLGLQHEIKLNAVHLARPVAEVLSTILHEQLHQWERQWGRRRKGGRKGGANGYHTQEFRAMAKRFGLIVNERGHHLGIEPGPFTRLLAQYNIDMGTLPSPPGEMSSLSVKRPHGDSKLKKWSCACPVNVRCAVALRARCLRCGAFFEESRPAW